MAVGVASNGGNMCDAAPFVLSFPPHGPVRLDGPLDSCNSVNHALLPDRISFSTTPLPGSPADTWSWTPDNGLTPTGKKAFVPDLKKGWSDLRSRAVTHRLSYFGAARSRNKFTRSLGGNRPTFFRSSTVLAVDHLRGTCTLGRLVDRTHAWMRVFCLSPILQTKNVLWRGS